MPLAEGGDIAMVAMVGSYLSGKFDGLGEGLVSNPVS
jgi:hypothetical protein